MSVRKILIGYIIWWLIWSLVHAIIVLYLGFSVSIAIADSLWSNVILAAVSIAMANILRYYQPGKSTAWNLLFWSILLSGVSVFFTQTLLGYLYSWNVDYIYFLKMSLPIRYCISFLIIGCVLLLSWIWRTLITQQGERERKADMEKIARQAELEGLRKQIQPHFLFNSLNSISSLIGSNPVDARRMIQKLSDFMRYTLKKELHQMTDLEEEFNSLQLYLDIEQLRFGHRLKTIVELPEDLVKAKIPVMLIQPVVENAIKFGLYGTTGECIINIKVWKENSELIIRIDNPFDSETAESNKGTGFGLSSIQRRLYLLFERNDLLQTQVVGSNFSTVIKIPQQQ